MIKIGTSGYAFTDWIGTVYPANVKKEDMLSFYETELGFNTVELNYTYYALPSQKAIAGISRKTSANFEFAVKANKAMTHDLIDKFSGKTIDNSEIFKKFRYSLEPLINESKLSCVLAQFPYSFHFSNGGVEYLERFRELMRDVPLVFEFRNMGWHNTETLKYLLNLGVGYCVVDEPKLKGLMPFNPVETSDLGYFRFHGRNANWFDAPLSVRYDYFYSEKELKSFIEPIKIVEKNTKKTLAFFNNCHAGSAAKNAIQMIKMFSNTSPL